MPQDPTPITIRPVAEAADLERVRELFREYVTALDFDLDFQDFAGELARLPGAYAPPRGCLLLAAADGAALGCIALRPLENGICEMKRLYVRPAGRGRGLGRRLIAALLDQARELGYRVMRLDTAPGMEAAQSLYRAFGFRDIGAYCYNPLPGARFLECDLAISRNAPDRERTMPAIFQHDLTVPDTAIDQNGHVNNVAYVQWMQDSAVRHSHAQGATTDFYADLGVTWVVRSHFIEYLRPAMAGDRLEVFTWVADLRRSGSLRKYKFVRPGDGREIARARTEWVLVNVSSGRPCAVREEIRQRFQVVPAAEEP